MSTPISPAAALPRNLVLRAGLLALIAPVVAAVSPVMLTLWQAQLGLSAGQAGYVAAMELLAQVAGTGLFLYLRPTWSWRRIALMGMAIMGAGNLASAGCSSLTTLILMWPWPAAGVAWVRALAVMCLARALLPGRAFACYGAAQVTLASMVTLSLPALVAALGARAPFVIVTLVASLGLRPCVSLRTIPGTPAGNARRSAGVMRPAGYLTVGALFLFFLGQGALWTYLEPIGRSRSIDPAAISRALVVLNVAGLAGTVSVGALAAGVAARTPSGPCSRLPWTGFSHFSRRTRQRCSWQRRAHFILPGAPRFPFSSTSSPAQTRPRRQVR
jgi:MFS family permease